MNYTATAIPANFTMPPRTQRGRQLLALAAAWAGCSVEELTKRPNRKYADIRYAVAYILHHEYGWDYTRIGKLINRDHSTVHYGYHKAAVLKVTDEAWARRAMLMWLATRDVA